MDKYAAVYFEPDESKKYRDFLKAMIQCGIITLSKEQIDVTIKDYEREKAGVMNRIVLHGEEETDKFRVWMEALFKDKEFRITDDPDDPDFDNWLKEKAKLRYTAE